MSYRLDGWRGGLEFLFPLRLLGGRARNFLRTPGGGAAMISISRCLATATTSDTTTIICSYCFSPQEPNGSIFHFQSGGSAGGGALLLLLLLLLLLIVSSYRKIMDPFSISNPIFFKRGGPVLLFRREGCGEAGGK